MDHICNESCRARPTCTVCRQRKAPTGRDPGAMSHCAEECPGHYAAPHPGHLWPGEECYGPGHKYGTDCPACVGARAEDDEGALRSGSRWLDGPRPEFTAPRLGFTHEKTVGLLRAHLNGDRVTGDALSAVVRICLRAAGETMGTRSALDLTCELLSVALCCDVSASAIERDGRVMLHVGDATAAHEALRVVTEGMPVAVSVELAASGPYR